MRRLMLPSSAARNITLPDAEVVVKDMEKPGRVTTRLHSNECHRKILTSVINAEISQSLVYMKQTCGTERCSNSARNNNACSQKTKMCLHSKGSTKKQNILHSLAQPGSHDWLIKNNKNHAHSQPNMLPKCVWILWGNSGVCQGWWTVDCYLNASPLI